MSNKIIPCLGPGCENHGYIIELEDEVKKLTHELQSLIEFTKSEIGKLPPQYREHKQRRKL